MRAKVSYAAAVATVLLIVAAPARSQSVLELAVGIKFCTTLTDDAQRLKCFDGLFAQKSEPADKGDKGSTELAPNWSITESKSPLDDSPEVTASLPDDQTLLALRCKEHQTEVIFAARGTYLGSQPIKMLIRVNGGTVIKTLWEQATDGQAAFAPSAIAFIRALPQNGTLFLRATAYGGNTVDGDFHLGDVESVRAKIEAACHWGGGAASTPK